MSGESGGLLLLDKPVDWTSHDCVAKLRRRLGIAKIGHAGTLDPFATGVLVLLIGRHWTARVAELQGLGKSYWMKVRLGQATDTFDRTGQVLQESELVPSREALEEALTSFQGTVQQIPPMFSAKKVRGQRLYHLARRGREVERAPVAVHLHTTLEEYSYPHCMLRVDCSKGTYLRTIAQDLGQLLGTGAHAEELVRTRVGPFCLEDCVSIETLCDEELDLGALLLRPDLDDLLAQSTGGTPLSRATSS